MGGGGLALEEQPDREGDREEETRGEGPSVRSPSAKL